MADEIDTIKMFGLVPIDQWIVHVNPMPNPLELGHEVDHATIAQIGYILLERQA